MNAALRRNGGLEPRHVRVAMLEDNGGISVVPFPPGGTTEPPQRA